MRNRHSRQTLRYAAAALALIAVSALASSDSFAREQDPDVPVVLEVQPNCGSPGDQVTVRGVDFPNRPRVRVGNRRAKLVVSGDNVVTIVMPKQSEGSHTVLVTNRSRGRSAVTFLIPCDAGLLPGNPGDPALDAIKSIDPTPANNADIVGSVILTRITIDLAPGATVGEVNAAIKDIGGRIEGSFAGLPILSIEVPRQPDRPALDRLAAALEASGAILAAAPGQVAEPDNVPSGPVSIDYLKRTRFPAAWNALALARGGLRPGQLAPCDSRRVPVIVADRYATPAATRAPSSFAAEIPLDRVTEAAGDVVPPKGDHGYHVMATLAAGFDGPGPLVGAVPLPECLELKAFQVGNVPSRLVPPVLFGRAFPSSGKFVLNTSFGAPFICTDGGACLASTVDTKALVQRALNVAIWKSLTSPLIDRFVHATSAGNSADRSEGQTYPGAALAEFNNAFTAALITDPSLARYSDTSLWAPNVAGLPNIALSIEDEARVEVYRDTLGVGSVPRLDNTLAVGSVDASGTESKFSNSNPTVRAVGEGVPILGGVVEKGNSLTSPQVAGLAAYLWLLSPQLRDLPARETSDLIGVSTDPDFPREIDALTAVLALDAATSDPTAANSPVRLAMLDHDDNGKFDENDLANYRSAYLDFAGKPLGSVPDLGRFDLNGDGLKSAETTDLFDLDRGTSQQFGATVLDPEDQIKRDIGGNQVLFPETAVSDLDVVCFYAFSALYTGSPDLRKAFMGEPCGGPPAVKFLRGQAQISTVAQHRLVSGELGSHDPKTTETVDFQPLPDKFDRPLNSSVASPLASAGASQTTTVTENADGVVQTVTSQSEISSTTSAPDGNGTEPEAKAQSDSRVSVEVNGPTTITLTGSLDADQPRRSGVCSTVRLSGTFKETAASVGCGSTTHVDLNRRIDLIDARTQVVSFTVVAEVGETDLRDGTRLTSRAKWNFTLTFTPA